MTIKGIDISDHQDIISWDQVSGIDFVIIRAGYGRNNLDKYAIRNIQGCKNNNIPFGLYWFSYALSISDAIKEADYVCDIADKYKLTFPVIGYDWEYDSDNYASRCRVPISNSIRRQFAVAFLKRVKQRGYSTLLYTNYDYLNKGFRELIGSYDIWFAAPDSDSKPDIAGLTIWQYSWTGRLSGISGNIDMNCCYKDYRINPSPSPSPSPSPLPSDSSIKDVQKWLNSKYNTGLDVDGIYGPKTKAGLVKALQTELNRQCGAGLVVDGIYGPKTNATVPNLSEGMEGNMTKTLQGLLICNGYDTNGFDGIYGVGTASAVRSYQDNRGLSADGIAGKNTFTSLCE